MSEQSVSFRASAMASPNWASYNWSYEGKLLVDRQVKNGSSNSNYPKELTGSPYTRVGFNTTLAYGTSKREQGSYYWGGDISRNTLTTSSPVFADLLKNTLYQATPMIVKTEGSLPSQFNALNVARAKAQERAMGTWDVGTSAAEFYKIADTIIQLIRLLVNPLTAFRALQWRGIPLTMPQRHRYGTEKEFAAALDLFLQARMLYRYGIMPTVYDICDALKAYNDIMDDGKQYRRTFRGSQVVTGEITVTRTLQAGGGFTTNGMIREVTSSFVMARVTITDRMKVSFNLDDRIPQHVFWNQAYTAWELVPFSWIVDWLIDVGGFLSQLSPKPSFVAERFVTETIRESRRYYRPTGTLAAERRYEYKPGYFEYQKSQISGPGGVEVTESYERNVYPDTQPYLPGVNVSMNPARWLDVLTILRNLTRK